mgnify:CR=1 FL=1
MTTQDQEFKIPKVDLDTVVTFNEEDATAEVDTFSPDLQAKLEALGYKPRGDAPGESKVYDIPKNLVLIGATRRGREKRPSTRTPEQKFEKYHQLRRGKWVAAALRAGEDKESAVKAFEMAFAEDPKALYKPDTAPSPNGATEPETPKSAAPKPRRARAKQASVPSDKPRNAGL